MGDTGTLGEVLFLARRRLPRPLPRARRRALGGVLSALDGVGPEDLDIAGLVARVVEGQTTAHDIIDRPAHGMPVGGALADLDDGTLTTALKSRRPF